MEKPKKTKKTKSSDPCPLPGLSPHLAHGSELFFVFSRFWPNCKKTMETKKVQTHVPCQASPQTLSMGLNLLFFCFFGFSMVFLHVFHVKMLSSQYLSKNARFYNLHTCAPQAKLPKKHGKTKRTKKFRPMSPARPLPRPCPWVYFFLFFFGFLEVLSKLQKKKQQKTK